MIEFDRRAGRIARWVAHGRDLLAEGPRLSFWRAPIDNDAPLVPAWRREGYHLLQHRVDAVSWEEVSGGATVRIQTRIGAPGSARGFTAVYDYLFDGEGGTVIDVSLQPVGAPLSPLPRVGLEMKVPQSLGNALWYGRGPGETYVDSLDAGRFGAWRRTVDELATHYVHPQENGNRADMRWVCLTDAGGTGLFARAYPALSFSARRWSTEALAAAAHPTDLRPEDSITLNLDYRHQGLGSATCGPGPWERYVLKPEAMSFRVRLAPMDLGLRSPWLVYRDAPDAGEATPS